mmetsp:Transcript_38673/g.82260  ORF Transcript_38673/g.82260 Transcript_38673/m.82260 type:complete len:202 (+) Transcript_38673:423-1028(+)
MIAMTPKHVGEALLLHAHAREVGPGVPSATALLLDVVEQCRGGHGLVAAALAHAGNVRCGLFPDLAPSEEASTGIPDDRLRMLSREHEPLVVLWRAWVQGAVEVTEDALPPKLVPDHLSSGESVLCGLCEAELARCGRDLGKLPIDVGEALQWHCIVGDEDKLLVPRILQCSTEHRNLATHQRTPPGLHARHCDGPPTSKR